MLELVHLVDEAVVFQCRLKWDKKIGEEIFRPLPCPTLLEKVIRLVLRCP